MSELSRIGVALESDLLDKFDRWMERRGYPSRSEAFRDLIRDALVTESSAADNAIVVGSITLVYDHHVRQLTAKLTGMQHEHHEAIVSTLHVHLDGDNCLEVIVVRGKVRDVREIANTLISTKGVRHGRLTIADAATASDDRRLGPGYATRFGMPREHAPHSHGHGRPHSHSPRQTRSRSDD